MRVLAAIVVVALACQSLSAKVGTDSLRFALEDSISKELSYIPAYMGYDYVDMPDSVIMSKLSKYNASFSSLKIDSIKLPNDVSMGEKMLPDSAKIELPGSGIVLSVYNDRKGLAILKAAPEIKYTLSRQETTEILKLIKQIFFVNRGKIIIAKRRLPYGGIIADFLPMIKSQIYYKGKEQSFIDSELARIQEDHIITYSQPFIELWRISNWYAIRLSNKWGDINRKEERERRRQLLIRRRARERERQHKQAEQAQQAEQAVQVEQASQVQ